MRSPLLRRLRAIEAQQGAGVKKHPMHMTDDELWLVLDIRDPETGALRKDSTDEELGEYLKQAQQETPAQRLLDGR